MIIAPKVKAIIKVEVFDYIVGCELGVVKPEHGGVFDVLYYGGDFGLVFWGGFERVGGRFVFVFVHFIFVV